MNEQKQYKGSKTSRLKTMLSIGIITSALMFVPGTEKDVQAAGAMHNAEVQKQQIFKPSAEQANRINKSIEKFERQRDTLKIKPKTTKNNFKDNLRVDNPDSEYYQSNSKGNSVISDVKISNSKIHGNVKIGQIVDERDRY